MEKQFVLEVVVLLDGDDEAIISDKRSLIFNNIMAAITPIALGTRVSEPSRLKEPKKT